MLTDPATLLGLGDGGAHVAMIVDASAPSDMLTHWARDRKRGPGLPLEFVVKRQTSETADFFGFHDRGRLKPGKRADLNLIDFAQLRLHTPEVAHDLPAGGKRLVQRGRGLRGDPRCRHPGLRARRAHRRHARPPRAPRAVDAPDLSSPGSGAAGIFCAAPCRRHRAVPAEWTVPSSMPPTTTVRPCARPDCRRLGSTQCQGASRIRRPSRPSPRKSSRPSLRKSGS